MDDAPRAMKMTHEDAIEGLPEEVVKEAPIGPFVGIATLALNMALKFHDTTIIKDGAMYQQYKLEGRNLRTLDLDAVFETAIKMEQHLVNANHRVAQMIVVEALESKLEDVPDPDNAGDTATGNEGGDAAA